MRESHFELEPNEGGSPDMMKQNLVRSFVILITASSLFLVCATNRAKSLTFMAAVGGAAATAGALSAPPEEQSGMHAVFWGAVGAAVAGVVGLFVFDEQSRSEELERKLEVSKRELDAFRGEMDGTSQSSLIQSDSALGKNLPPEYRDLVKPGKWSLYKINTWVSQGENTLVHQDKMLRIEPPQFQPNANSSTEKKEGEVK